MDEDTGAPGVDKSLSPVKRSPLSRESSRDRNKKRRSRSRSRDRRRRRSYSRSKSPAFVGRGFRGNRNNRHVLFLNSGNSRSYQLSFRFNNRRSPFRGQRFNRFNDRRSRSRSRDRFDNNRGRRFDRNRRSRSESPARNNDYMQQQQQAAAMYNDGYGYIPNAPAPPNFGTIAQMGSQFNSYDFQGASTFAPPAPNFGGIACPAPPGLSESWSQPPVQMEESEEDRLKREGEMTWFLKILRSMKRVECCNFSISTHTSCNKILIFCSFP